MRSPHRVQGWSSHTAQLAAGAGQRIHLTITLIQDFIKTNGYTHTTANTLHYRSEHELLALPPECQKCRMQSIDSRLEDMGLDNAQAS